MEDADKNCQLRALEQKIDELSVDVSTQVSSAMAVWRLKEAELFHLLHLQQEELQQLRVQQALVASIENQWRECLVGLHMLQQDHKQFPAGESIATPTFHASGSLCREAVTETLALLRELKDERSIVADMLDSVKKEKCEVIAMMHIFATSKAEAIEELDDLRHVARDEISALACRVWSSAPAFRGCDRHRNVSSACAGGHGVAAHDQPEPVQTGIVHGLCAGSRAASCSASVLAPVVPSVTGIRRLTQPLVGQKRLSGGSGVPVSVPVPVPGAIFGAGPGAAGNHIQQRHSTCTASAEPSVQSRCSPVRQQTPGVSATRLLSANTACSPHIVPRPVIVTAEIQKSPIHSSLSRNQAQVGRQASRGQTPGGLALGHSISANWATVSQGLRNC
mmetsp:Transcript_68350/g.135081  ORF Transcript_68350/g.135081 Transcript_68350/m.135081 type:complete len:392 (-) Transcript_68350:65-1240(-)